MLLRFVEYFLKHAESEEVKQILKATYDFADQMVTTIKQILSKQEPLFHLALLQMTSIQGSQVIWLPVWTDVLHMISKIEVPLFAFHSTMSYRKDIRHLFKQLTANSQEMYDMCIQFLEEKGILSRPPYMSMPTEVTFIQNDNYLSGFHLFKDKEL